MMWYKEVHATKRYGCPLFENLVFIIVFIIVSHVS